MLPHRDIGDMSRLYERDQTIVRNESAMPDKQAS